MQWCWQRVPCRRSNHSKAVGIVKCCPCDRTARSPRAAKQTAANIGHHVLWMRCCQTSAYEVMDNQMCCSTENLLELPHVDAIHSSKESITIVHATDDQSVDHYFIQHVLNTVQWMHTKIQVVNTYLRRIAASNTHGILVAPRTSIPSLLLPTPKICQYLCQIYIAS